MSKTIKAAAFLAASCVCASPVLAAPISFESILGMTPVEGMEITNQFAGTAGVTFGLVDGLTGTALASGPKIAQVGEPRTAFEGFGGVGDAIAPASAAQIGNFFLTDDGLTSGGLQNPILVATYSVASSFITADILDLDFAEQFDIRFYDSVTGGNLLNTISLSAGSANTGNGVATSISYNHGSAQILRVEFEGRGNVSPAAGFFGLGFDNFDSGVVITPPNAVPLPATGLLLVAGLAGIAGVRRKRSA